MQTMVMEKISQVSVADMYGEDIPEHIYDEIRNILIKLKEIGVSYPDITGYNFIGCGDLVWVIDFEHAYIPKRFDSFLEKFIDGRNK